MTEQGHPLGNCLNPEPRLQPQAQTREALHEEHYGNSLVHGEVPSKEWLCPGRVECNEEFWGFWRPQEVHAK